MSFLKLRNPETNEFITIGWIIIFCHYWSAEWVSHMYHDVQWCQFPHCWPFVRRTTTRASPLTQKVFMVSALLFWRSCWSNSPVFDFLRRYEAIVYDEYFDLLGYATRMAACLHRWSSDLYNWGDTVYHLCQCRTAALGSGPWTWRYQQGLRGKLKDLIVLDCLFMLTMNHRMCWRH